MNKIALIVLALIDDIGYNDWTSHNTPYIKRLEKESRYFTRAYHPNSVCTPNRVSLFTGKYPIDANMSHNNLIHEIITSDYIPYGLPFEHKTLAELFPSEYIRRHIGKDHLGSGQNCMYCPLNR